MMSHTVLMLGLLVGTTDAVRKEQNIDIDIDLTKSWPGCPDCGATLGSLLQGIHDAGYLMSASWTGNVLKATLNTDELYGTIATRSRNPQMWKVDKDMTFTVRSIGIQNVIDVEGLSIWGSSQSLKLYKEAMAAKKLDGSSCAGKLEDWDGCIKLEIKAAGNYLSKKWNSIKKDKRKITSVLKTMYSGAMYMTVKVAGKWPEIFYSLLLTNPKKLTRFEITNGQISASGELDKSHPDYEEYKKLNLFQKAIVGGLKSLLTLPSALFKQAVSNAKSSLNLAMMLSYGVPEGKELLDKASIPAGSVKAIKNLMSWCAGSKAGTDPECKGKQPGRVSWGPQPPPSMA